jgi:hypothetical protein
LAAIIGEAGGDLATAKVLHVEVSVGADLMAFDVLRVPGASLDAFTAAAAPRSAEVGITERSSRTLSGRSVIRYSTPADYVGPPSSMNYTSRGDDIYIFGSWTDEQLGVLLAELK